MSVTSDTRFVPVPPDRLTPQAARFAAAMSWHSKDSRQRLLGACLPAGWPPALEDDAAAYRRAGNELDIVMIAVPSMNAAGDGPIMRTAHRTTLAAGWKPDRLPGLVRTLAGTGTMVLVTGLWSSFTGNDPGRLAAELAAAGAAGVVIPDMPDGESVAWTGPAADEGLHTIPVVPRRGLPRTGSGAVYLPVPPGPVELTARRHTGMVSRIRQVQDDTRMPVIAAIGISTSNRAVSAARAGAAGIFLGGALVAAMTSHPDSAAAAVTTVTARFRSALETASVLPG